MSQRTPSPDEIETFAREYVLTSCYLTAFKKAFPRTKAETTIRVGASRVATHSKVEKRIKEIRLELGIADERSHIITFDEKQGLLKVIIDEGLKYKVDKFGNKLPIDLKAAISAIETLNKMDGHNAPTKIENSGNVKFVLEKKVINAIRKR